MLTSVYVSRRPTNNVGIVVNSIPSFRIIMVFFLQIGMLTYFR